MKTEYEYGELYAEWVLNQKPFGELCNMDYNKCHPIYRLGIIEKCNGMELRTPMQGITGMDSMTKSGK